MNRALLPPVRDSLIEIELSGRNLSARDKMQARALLNRCRILENDLACSDYRGRFTLSCYTRSSMKVKEVRRAYQALRERSFKLRVKTLRRRDWFDKWKREYRIGPLGRKFMIVPFWERKKFISKQRTPIFLEPGSAFGSGYHETTRLMTRLLETLEGRIENFLDIGTGTGILSVVAAKLGARGIVGFDNDRPSALVAAKNFKVNACDGGTFFCAQLKSLKIAERFDTVAANLLSKTLLELRKKVLARVRVGGYLLVSGISIQNFPAFRRGFFISRLKCLKVLRGRRWVAALYRKR